MQRKKENQVYRCTWRKVGRRYVLTCKDPVSATVKSENLQDAQDKLFSEIMTLTGDGEPCFQFVPDLPRPEDRKDLFAPEYYCIRANDRVEWLTAKGSCIDDLWQEGLCTKCKCGRGMRSETARTMTTSPRYDLALFYKDRNVAMMLSTRVLKHLLPHLAGRIKLVPVNAAPTISKRLKGKYFELSFAPEINTAIPRERQPTFRSRPDLSGWRCKACGRFMVHWWNPEIGPVAYGLERSHAKGAVLLVQNGPVLSLAVNKSVHDSLCADKSLRGFVSERAAMFDSDQVLSPSELAKLKLPQIQA